MSASGPAYTIGQQVLRRGGRIMLGREATLEISGAEHIPAHGACVLVARHYHHLLDGCALYQATDRPLHILVGLDWAGQGMLRRGMDYLCRMAGWPVIMRPHAEVMSTGGVDVQRSLRKGMRESVSVLADGQVLVVFPEGYPVVDPHASTPRGNADGLLPFQAGVVRLVRMAESRTGHSIPMVPVGLDYQAEGDRWSIRLTAGAPVKRRDVPSDAELLRTLEGAVARLSGVDQEQAPRR